MPLGRERRCPRLGHELAFSYCLACGENGGLCWKIADCWWEVFDVIGYLRENYPEETVAALLVARPQSKITGILELIQQAQENNKDSNGG